MTCSSLCQPGRGLSCFACCPPIRPAGYDHADHRGSLRRLFSESRAAHLRGELPLRPMVGYSCPGLGFLDGAGRMVGCLLHPARHPELGPGQDPRLATGYAAKCARESCPQARAYAEIKPSVQARLLGLCEGLDAFAFSSPRENPARLLLAFGPVVTAAAMELDGLSLDTLRDWRWLRECQPAWGWLLGLALEQAGAELLLWPHLDLALAKAAAGLARDLGPSPPLEQGGPLSGHCEEWEARLWLALSGRRRLTAGRLANWRALARRAAEALA